ncbi:sulfurtransferase TusA [Endozoicomonas atrinae]|uniref:sulfurtransferase TusA n=1 Tax=Endozoicomonas atrinae TaxID=1333660 RepID=UPI0008254D4A|nr:sulfurtransferase TusA [Endozoicomonas atrinae]
MFQVDQPEIYEVTHHLDATGLVCPEPVMLLHNIIRKMSGGDVLEMIATDPSTQRDIPKFCTFLNHDLLQSKDEGGRFVYHLRKGVPG